MMLWLLSAVLLIWEPLNVARELFAAAPMLGQRGLPAVVELIAHASVAALTAAAGLAIANRNPLAPRLAVVALVASALRVVQTLYWSALPHDVVPGDELPLAAFAILHAAFWIVYLRRSVTVSTIFPM
jgi:hypothetical protein